MAGLSTPRVQAGDFLAQLAEYLHGLRAVFWQDQLAELHRSDVTALREAPSSRGFLLTRLFGLWKVGQRIPDPCVLDIADQTSIRPPALEACALSQHWAQTFDVIDLQDEPDISDFEPFIQPLPWGQHTFSLEEAAEHVQYVAPTRGGPDDMEYKMFKDCPQVIASIACDAYTSASTSGTLPASLLASNTVFIPKSAIQGALPADIRPLSLNNIIVKIVPAVWRRKPMHVPLLGVILRNMIVVQRHLRWVWPRHASGATIDCIPILLPSSVISRRLSLVFGELGYEQSFELAVVRMLSLTCLMRSLWIVTGPSGPQLAPPICTLRASQTTSCTWVYQKRWLLPNLAYLMFWQTCQDCWLRPLNIVFWVSVWREFRHWATHAERGFVMRKGWQTLPPTLLALGAQRFPDAPERFCRGGSWELAKKGIGPRKVSADDFHTKVGGQGTTFKLTPTNLPLAAQPKECSRNPTAKARKIVINQTLREWKQQIDSNTRCFTCVAHSEI